MILILPHQLHTPHPCLHGVTKDVILWEHPLFFGTDRHYPLNIHKQKLVLHRASMAAYAADLSAQGHRVTVLRHDQPLAEALPRSTRVLQLADPGDFLVERRLQQLAAKRGLSLQFAPSPHFLSPPELLASHCNNERKKPFMARFYEAQRRRMAILLEADQSPRGGRWSFDEDNRQKLPTGHIPPAVPQCPANEWVRAAQRSVESEFPHNFGTTEHFRYPVTRDDALVWLEQFIAERLAGFGPYEDAISTRHTVLYHSALSPMLNIGLLGPGEVVSAALNSEAKVPLQSLEGFVRQVIGWREFMFGIYRHRSVALRTRNFWGFTRKIPRSFYEGTTGIPPIDRLIVQLQREAWCHHIERLMVLGNFMLLCRFEPTAVYRWFMEVFIDAYDWVMVPNVYGMSQFACGGSFTTKPYLSGSNYVCKMSDENKGPWCATWDGLFWAFIADHSDFFIAHPRLSMMARTWYKLPPAKQQAHLQAAADYFAMLDAAHAIAPAEQLGKAHENTA